MTPQDDDPPPLPADHPLKPLEEALAILIRLYLESLAPSEKPDSDARP